MARVAGVDLPRNKRVVIALTYIYGVGTTTAHEILKKAGVGVGVAWTAPVVTSLATPAAAATCLHSFSLIIGTTATS